MPHGDLESSGSSSMLLRVLHRTTYRYSESARDSMNELRLSPEETVRQQPRSCSIEISPQASLSESRDLFGNLVHSFTIEKEHTLLSVTANSLVETRSFPHLVYRSYTIPIDPLPCTQKGHLPHDFLTGSSCVPPDPHIWREALDIKAGAQDNWGHLLAGIRNHIFETCTYREQHLHVMRTSTEIQRERIGTCQDFAHLMIAQLRSLSIPARYCSGYLYDPGLDGKDSPELLGAAVTHAWVEALVPGIGWLGVDPTNRCWVDERYVSVALGRDYHDIVPIRGSLIGGGKDRSLGVLVEVKAV